jgi:small subunit ribosomal protein S21
VAAKGDGYEYAVGDRFCLKGAIGKQDTSGGGRGKRGMRCSWPSNWRSYDAHDSDILLDFLCQNGPPRLMLRSAADLAGLEVYFILAEVRVQEGEPLENALRRFKRKVQTEDIIKEVKRHSFYLKPGEKKRVKEALARKRNRKKVRKEQD